MKNLFFISCFLLLSQSVKGEVSSIASIFELCMRSSLIAEAYLENIEDENYVFLYREFNKENLPYKRLIVPNLSNRYDLEGARINRKEIQQLKYQLGIEDFSMVGLDTVNIDNADKIILFLKFKNTNEEPILTGIRLIKKGLVFYPIQRSYPGKISFDNNCKLDEYEFNYMLTNKIEESIALKKILKSYSSRPKHNNKLRRWLKNYMSNDNSKIDEFIDCVAWRSFDSLEFLFSSKDGENLNDKIKRITFAEVQKLYVEN